MMSMFRRVIRLLLHPDQLRRQSGLLLQYLVFRMRYAFVRVHSDAPPTGKDVLIVNFTDWMPRAQTEGLLMRHLQQRGYRPVVLTKSDCHWSMRTYRLFGVDSFVMIDDPALFDPQDDERITSIIREMKTPDDILRFTLDDLPIGQSILSTLIRNLCRPTLDLTDPEAIALLRRILHNALQSARAIRAYYDSTNIEAVFFNEIGFVPYSVFFFAALHRRIPVIQYVHAQRLDAFVFHRHTVERGMIDPVHVTEESWEKILALPWTAAVEETFMKDLKRHYEQRTWFNLMLSEEKIHKSPEEVRRQIGLDPNKKTAVIFTGVVWDDTFFLGKNLFENYDHWLVETLKIACANTHVQWVIKLHPDYLWYTENKGIADRDAPFRDLVAVMANIEKLPDHIKIVPPDTDISTYSFFAVTDYCITVRGTVGIEFPTFGVTTFVAGNGKYSNFGFTENSETREEYLEKMRYIQDWAALSPERRTLARRHAHALFVLRVAPTPSMELVPIRKNKRVVSHKMAMHARSARDLDEDQGLRGFAEWLLHSKDEDYLRLPQKTAEGYTWPQ